VRLALVLVGERTSERGAVVLRPQRAAGHGAPDRSQRCRVQSANAFLGRFPFAKLGISAAENSLARSGLDYQRDIKPLLGNPVALGAARAGSLSGSKFLLVFVAAIRSYAATVGASYGAFLARQASDKAKTGVDITNDVFSQFSGKLEVDYSPAGVMARADVRDPAAAARTLAKLGTSAGQVVRHAKQVSPAGNGFYVTKDGTKTVTFGLVGNHFVVGTVPPAALTAFAGAPTSPVAGAQGPVAFRVALGPIISLAMAGGNSSAASNPAVQAVLGMFSDATGWAANDPSGLHGALSVGVK